MKWINEYHERVDSGQIIVCESMQLQIERVKKFIDKYEYDSDEVANCIGFIESCVKHFKGAFAGKPFKLSLWQKYIISVCFGFYEYIEKEVVDVNGDVVDIKKERRRLTTKCFIEVARKNGKSMFGSALALYMMLADGEESPECYLLANTLRQVNETIYKTVLAILAKNKDLSSFFIKRRTDLELLKGGTLAPLASDSNNLDGLNPSFSLFDEVHMFENDNLIEVIESGLASRENPMLMFITSNGMTRGKVFDNLVKYYKSILRGKIEDDNTAIFIFEQDSEDEIKNEQMWIKSNPNLKISVDFEYLRRRFQLIYDKPENKNSILSKNFCIPQNSSSVYFSVEESKMCENVDIDELMKKTYGTFGVDLSMSRDLTVLTYLFEINEIKYIKQWYFLPKEILDQKINEDKVPYNIWAEQGHLILLEGDYINVADVFDFMIEQINKFELYPQKIGFDRYYASDFLNKTLDYFGDYMPQAVIQGLKTRSPILNELKVGLNKRTIIHNSPMLEWNLLNAVVISDKNENVDLDKRNKLGRIDGVDSLIDAFHVWNEFNQESNLLKNED